MTLYAKFCAAALLALPLPIFAAETPEPAQSPNEIVAAAPDADWVSIAAEDLLVMTLAPTEKGEERKVIIQLIPAPFSEGWTANIRTLAKAHWYDGLSINRVQDNYVVQWGDANGDDAAKAKPLPKGLEVMKEEEYLISDFLAISDPRGRPRFNYNLGAAIMKNAMLAAQGNIEPSQNFIDALEQSAATGNIKIPEIKLPEVGDRYAAITTIIGGWPIAGGKGKDDNNFWPTHCYGMVGVGRSLSPDTGSGAELYTVIGHAPRHLDRNIALVGRVIEGIEHLSSLPRGKGDLGFYQTPEERTPITSIRLASELPKSEQPKLQFLNSESESFEKYIAARANRRDAFFIQPAGGVDICNAPVPIRRAPKK